MPSGTESPGKVPDGFLASFSSRPTLPRDERSRCTSPARSALPGVGQQDRERSGALLAALDKCNRRFGSGTVVTSSTGMPTVRTWATKVEMRSPRSTTRLSEVPVVGSAVGGV